MTHPERSTSLRMSENDQWNTNTRLRNGLEWFTKDTVRDLEAAMVHAEYFLSFLHEHIHPDMSEKRIEKKNADWIYSIGRRKRIDWASLHATKFITIPFIWLTEYNGILLALHRCVSTFSLDKWRTVQNFLIYVRHPIVEWLDNLVVTPESNRHTEEYDGDGVEQEQTGQEDTDEEIEEVK